MARRMTPSQAKAAIRRAQSRQREAARKANQAINDYNRKARSHNAKLRTSVNNYNRDVDRYNREVRSQNARRRQAVDRYNRAVRAYNRNRPQTRTGTRTTHIRSVQNLQESFARLESSSSAHLGPELLDLSEREAANSAEAINALLDPSAEHPVEPDAELDQLRATSITTELAAFSADLDGRWRGALFALHPRNPDAARHFCTSAREAVGSLLALAAPDEAVKSSNPNYIKTPNGDVSRRARIHHCLALQTSDFDELVDFVEADIDNLIDLFDDFNSGTHGESGRFPLAELVALKSRVEDAIKFVYRLARGPAGD
ncbi:MAG: hypothetical protein GY788_01485 [bacterium]|nr:hypothetical protein [bacterium]